MGMVVVVMAVVAISTNRIFGLELLVWNSMENPRIQELFETPVNGGAVNAAGKFLFQVSMRQCCRIS